MPAITNIPNGIVMKKFRISIIPQAISRIPKKSKAIGILKRKAIENNNPTNG